MTSLRVASLLLLALLLGVLSLSAWLRGSAGRDWLVDHASARLEASAGYRLQAAESAGNPWRGLALFDLRLEGPGADLQVARLDLAYGLGQLVRGRLPLTVRLSGLRGELDPEALSQLELTGAGGSGPQLELRSLEISDVQLELAGTALALSDLWVRELQANTREEGLSLSGQVGSGEAVATLRAELDAEPLELRLAIDEADVSLLRGFWQGAQAGTLSGQLTLLSGPPQGEFTLRGGRAELAGLTLREVAGPLSYHHPQLRAELTGQTLDGPVQASAEVDLAARHWRASAQGRPALARVGDWLAEGRLAWEPSALLALAGEAEVALLAEGWQQVALSGTAQGQGSALGRVLDGLEARFGFSSGLGAHAAAQARWGEGRLEVALEPTDTGFFGHVVAEGVALDEAEGGLRADFRASATSAHGVLEAEAAVALAGELLARPLELNADARLEDGRWRAEATGAYGGAPLSAAALVDDDGLRARADLSELPWPITPGSVALGPITPGPTTPGSVALGPITPGSVALGPVALARASLELSGPLAEVRWELALAGDAPLALEIAGVRLGADLRGRLGGSLNAEGLRVDEGALGPLELRGDYRADEGALELRYRAEGLALAGSVSGEVALDGALRVAGARLETEGALRAASLRAGPLTLQAVETRFAARRTDGDLALTLSDPRGLELRYQTAGDGPGPSLEARLQAFPVLLGNSAWTLDGAAEGWDEALELELRARSEHAELRLAGGGESARLRLEAAPGQRFGPLELAQPLVLDGELRALERALELAGQAGELPLELRAGWRAAGLGATAALTSAGDSLVVHLGAADPDEGTLRLLGELPLAPLGALVGLELAGSLQSDLERHDGQWRGAARLAVANANGEPWRLAVLGEGAALGLSGGGAFAGQTLALRGQLSPELEVALELGAFGAAQLRRDPQGELALTGGGALRLAALGLDESWRLEGSPGAQQATFELGASRAVLAWDKGWRVQASLEQRLGLAGVNAQLKAELEASATDPAGALRGTLQLERTGEQASLALSGTLREARLTGSLPGALLGAPTASSTELEGTASLLGGARYALEARTLGLGDAAVELELAGTASSWQASLRGDGLAASARASLGDAPVWWLELERFAPAQLAAALPETLALSGRLEGSQGGYGGELRASLDQEALGQEAPDQEAPVFTLRGAGDALLLQADGEIGGTRVVADGTLLPNLGLGFSFRQPGLAELTGEVTGTPDAPELRGELVLAAQEAGGATLLEQRLVVAAGWGGASREASGSAGLWARLGEARLDEHGWTGELALELALQGEAHRLVGPLRGPLAAPRWEAALAGPLANGALRASPAGAEGHMSVEAQPWLGERGEGRLDATLEATPDGRWSLTVAGVGEAAALPGRALELAGTVSGEGSAYTGEGSLQLAGQPLLWELAGEGGALRATLEGEGVALAPLALPGEPNGQATGVLELSRAGSGALGYRVDVEAAGALRGEAYRLALQGDETGLAVSGLVGAVTLQGDYQQDALALRASGRWQARDLEAELDYTDGEGRWQVRYHGSQLAGALRASVAPEAELEFSGEGALVALPGLGDAAVALAGRWQDGRLELETAWLESEPLALTLRGRAWPEAALTGELRAAALGEPLELELSSEGANVALRLQGEAALAALRVDPGASAWQLERLELALPSGLALAATGAGDLGSGALSGALSGRGERLPFDASYGADGLALRARGPLLGGQLDLQAHHQAASGWQGALAADGLELAGATLSLQGALAGALAAPALDGLVRALAPWGAAQATFSASPAALELAGSLDATRLAQPLEVAGRLWPRPELTLSSGSEVLRLADGSAQGSLSLELGEELARLELNATGSGAPEIALALGGDIGPRLRGSWPETVQELRLSGSDNTTGSLRLTLEPLRLELEALRWTGALGAGELTGALALTDGPRGRLTGSWTWPDAARAGWLPWRGALGRTDVELELSPGRLELAAGALVGELAWQDALSFRLQGSQPLGAGALQLDVAYQQTEGPSGSVSLQGVELLTPESASAQGLGSLELFAELELSPVGLSGTARLEAERGIFRLSGEAGWQRVIGREAAARLAPAASADLQGLIRLEAFNLAYLPAVAAALPELDAPVSGVAQVIGDTVLGQVLIPELRVAGRRLDSAFDFSGNLQAVEITGRVDRSRLSLRYGDERLSGLVNLEGFPAESLVEARFGATGVSASTTALLRFEVPLADLAKSDVRLASERIRLEQAGAASEGQLALRYDEGGLVLETAEFRGAGLWRAQGQLGPGGLDFELHAEDADFGPLLALVPALSGLQPGVRGSLDLRVGGSAAAPTLSATSPELTVTLGGARYRLAETTLEVADGEASGRSRLEGVAPVGGALDLSLGGRMRLFPFEASAFRLAFAGSAELPAIGLVTGLEGEMFSDADAWRLSSSGMLGERFTLAGTLAPLDLELRGQQLTVAAPQYYLLSSTLDALLRLRFDEGYRLSGRLFGHEARLGFEGRGAPDAELPAPVSREGGSNALLERIVFDELELAVPQQLSFRESLGTLEMSAELTLTGTAAEPLLAGQARLLRGGLRFSGRDFNLQEGEALFAPTRGRYPLIRARAETSFDKARVLPAELRSSVSFAAPRESQSFRVFLEFVGEFEETAPGVQRLRLEPSLSSDALLEDRRSNGGSLRPLQDEEILTLLALGRLELGSGVRQALFGESVAQTALDTAVDLYLLSELQRALAEALGVELFEIRTGALSGLLEAGESDFSVAVRIGAYLSEEVFASVSLGRFQYAPELYALGGGFNLRYDLSPLELSLSGGLGLPGSGPRGPRASLGPVPEFNLGLSYGLTPLVNLGAGLDLRGGHDTSFGLRFGLDFRW